VLCGFAMLRGNSLFLAWGLRALIVCINIYSLLIIFNNYRSTKVTPSCTIVTETFPSFRGSGYARQNSTAAPFDTKLVDFWLEFSKTLEDNRPACKKLAITHAPPTEVETRWEPNKPSKPRMNHLLLHPQKFVPLRQAHATMANQSVLQAPRLHYNEGTKGIVTTAGPRYIPILLVSLRLIRRSGSKLPVEVFLGGWSEYNATLCEQVLPTYNARCRVITDIYNRAPNAKPLEKYQFKIFSILFSSFEDVLFLDADAFSGNNPDGIFTSEPYKSHGLVLWPDIFANTASHHYFKIAEINNPPPVSQRLSSESGQVLISKRSHGASLLLMTYYNYYGPDYYYPLLCQGSHGAGDKETFLHAALALNLPFWDVREPPWCIGHWKHEDFGMVAMGQHDPREDWKIVMGKNTSSDPAKARPLFVHNHFEKLDPFTIIKEEGPTRDDAGRYQRMWGSEEAVTLRFGHDLEKTVWQEVMNSGCQSGVKTCSRIRDYYFTIYGND
jgi:alpha 1,2-mannosyltransferase